MLCGGARPRRAATPRPPAHARAGQPQARPHSCTQRPSRHAADAHGARPWGPTAHHSTASSPPPTLVPWCCAVSVVGRSRAQRRVGSALTPSLPTAAQSSQTAAGWRQGRRRGAPEARVGGKGVEGESSSIACQASGGPSPRRLCVAAAASPRPQPRCLVPPHAPPTHPLPHQASRRAPMRWEGVCG